MYLFNPPTSPYAQRFFDPLKAAVRVGCESEDREGYGLESFLVRADEVIE